MTWRHAGRLAAPCIAAMLVAWGSAADALTPGEIRDANKDAVVYINVKGAGKNGAPYETDATGFMVSKTGEMVTAAHIFYDSSGVRLTNMQIAGSPGSRYDPQRREIELLDEDVNRDLALLRFKGNSNNYKAIHLSPALDPAIGARLIAVGFPKGTELSVIDGILSSKSGPRGWYQTNTDFIAGYSGGPVFDQETGATVGIVMAGMEGAAGHNFFLHISYANRLLSHLAGKPYAQKGQSCSPEVPCAPGLSCIESFTDIPVGAPREERGPSTGQRGRFADDDDTFDAGGDCPAGTRRDGSPRGDGSSNTTCTAAWLDVDNPASCRMRVHWSHGLGRWHCNIVFYVRNLERRSTGFQCH